MQVEDFWGSPFFGFHTVIAQVNICEFFLVTPLGQLVNWPLWYLFEMMKKWLKISSYAVMLKALQSLSNLWQMALIPNDWYSLNAFSPCFHLNLLCFCGPTTESWLPQPHGHADHYYHCGFWMIHCLTIWLFNK